MDAGTADAAAVTLTRSTAAGVSYPLHTLSEISEG